MIFESTRCSEWWWFEEFLYPGFCKTKGWRELVEHFFYDISYLSLSHQAFTGEFFLDAFPDKFNWIQIRGIRWKKHKDNIEKMCSSLYQSAQMSTGVIPDQNKGTRRVFLSDHSEKPGDVLLFCSLGIMIDAPAVQRVKPKRVHMFTTWGVLFDS